MDLERWSQHDCMRLVGTIAGSKRSCPMPNRIHPVRRTRDLAGDDCEPPQAFSPDADVRAHAQQPRDPGRMPRPVRYRQHLWSPRGRRLASRLRMVGVDRIRCRAAILPPPDDREGAMRLPARNQFRRSRPPVMRLRSVTTRSSTGVAPNMGRRSRNLQ